jgi:hypothetical protein
MQTQTHANTKYKNLNPLDVNDHKKFIDAEPLGVI